MSQNLPEGCLRGSGSLEFLLPWRFSNLTYDQGGLWPTLQLPLLGCHLGGSEAEGCPPYSGAWGGLIVSCGTGWSAS